MRRRLTKSKYTWCGAAASQKLTVDIGTVPAEPAPVRDHRHGGERSRFRKGTEEERH
jgi:hypothetical protein